MDRKNIYYWKSDAPNCFNLSSKSNNKLTQEQEKCLKVILEKFFKGEAFELKEGTSQGNHLTAIAICKNKKYFVRINDSLDNDNHFYIDGIINKQCLNCGVLTPEIYEFNADKSVNNFAYQIMEFSEDKDINSVQKSGEEISDLVFFELGTLIAKWQDIPVVSYGLFDVQYAINNNELRGYHSTYKDYYFLNLKKHLDFLVDGEFLEKNYADNIYSLIIENENLLDLERPVFVHKDLAFWNTLGTSKKITAVIDFDDSVGGDDTDDLATLACFYSADKLNLVLDGYKSVKHNLSPNFEKRFYLHFLRNILYKSVIRVGAGYFKKDKNFFLIDNNADTFKQFTLEKINNAYLGLKNNLSIKDL